MLYSGGRYVCYIVVVGMCAIIIVVAGMCAI